jgi:TRAP-type C4-dicarboxylate transport system substrate-binding protein
MEAAARTTKIIQEREKELVTTFKERGLTVTEVDRKEFADAVAKAVTFEEFGYRKEDWDKIQALQ